MGFFDGGGQAVGAAPTPPAAPGVQNPLALALLGSINSPARTLRTPIEIARNQQLAAALQSKGLDTSPIASPWQGVARIGNVLAGDYQASQSHDDLIAQRQYEQNALANALNPGGAGPISPLAAALDPSNNGGQQPATSGAAPSPVADAGGNAGGSNHSAFINTYAPMAQQASAATGVDPRIILAQAAQESGWGAHAPGGNMFGLKGPGQTLATSENVDGQNTPTTASFQQFASPADSFQGYSNFINSNPRYQGLQHAQGLDAQVAALGASGYATDPNYANSVGSIARGIQLPPSGPQTAQAAPGGGPIPDASQAYAPASSGLPPASPAMAAITSATGPVQGGAPSPAAQPPGGDPSGPPAAAPMQVAQNDAPGASSTGTASAVPQQGAMPRFDPQKLLALMTNPYVSPEVQQRAASMLQFQMSRPSYSYGKQPDGSIIQYSNLDGAKVIVPGESGTFQDPAGNTYAYDKHDLSKPPTRLNPGGATSAFRPMTDQERTSYNLPPDVRATMDAKGHPEVISGGEDKFGGAIIGSLSKKYAGMIDAVPAARQELQDLNGLQGALSSLQAAGGTTGFGSEEKIRLGNILNSAGSIFGMQPVDVNQLSNLEQVKKYSANLATAMMQNMQAGGSRGGAFVLKSIQKGQPGLDMSTLSNQRLVSIAQQDRMREIAIGEGMSDEAARAYSNKEALDPGKMKKIIDDYDAKNTAIEPMTGQNLNQPRDLPGAQPSPSPSNSSAQGLYYPQPGLNYQEPKSVQEYGLVPSGTAVKMPSKSSPTGYRYGIKP